MNPHEVYTIHEADVAIWHSYEDGFTILDPVSRKPIQAPLAACKASVSFSRTITNKERVGPGEWRGSQKSTDQKWNISISAPMSSEMVGDFRSSNAKNTPGTYTIVIRWTDSESGKSLVHQYHYANTDSEKASTQGQVMNQEISFISPHLEEFSGSSLANFNTTLEPFIMGRVNWSHGGRTLTCLLYNPLSNLWEETPENKASADVNYLYLGPSDNYPGDLHFSYLDLTLAGFTPPNLPRKLTVAARTRTAFTIRETPAAGHGLILRENHTLQLAGCPEPINLPDLSRQTEQPLITFSFLKRIYASIQGKIIAIPRLHPNQVPPPEDQPAFLIQSGDPLNPETLNRGLTLLPHGGFLDGKLYQTSETDTVSDLQPTII
jgi:hypothetical protein